MYNKKRKKICFITSSRADYGHQEPLMKLVKNNKNFIFQFIITGTHFSKDFGETYKQIIKDGFKPSAKIPLTGKLKTKKDIIAR